jgi:AraC-like DNA-binding protein
MAWGIYCLDAGAVEILPHEGYPYQADLHPPQYSKNWEKGRILSEFQFVYIAKGSGLFRTRKSEEQVQEGSFIILVPGEWHWYRPHRETGWIEYWVGFNGDWPQLLLERAFLGPTPRVINVGIRGSLIRYYNTILEEIAQEPPGYQQVISSFIPLILSEVIASASRPQIEARGRAVFEHVKAVFEENLYNRIDMESLATDLKLNYAVFREEFKAYTGLSPYQYFLQMKINRAKELLMDGEVTVKGISYLLAFDNPYYFSRLFKKKTGVSPSQWNNLQISEE